MGLVQGETELANWIEINVCCVPPNKCNLHSIGVIHISKLIPRGMCTGTMDICYEIHTSHRNICTLCGEECRIFVVKHSGTCGSHCTLKELKVLTRRRHFNVTLIMSLYKVCHTNQSVRHLPQAVHTWRACPMIIMCFESVQWQLHKSRYSFRLVSFRVPDLAYRESALSYTAP
jgi:hypothetical protein